MSDIYVYRIGICLSSWLRSTRYAVSDIYCTRVQVVLVAGYARGTYTRYAVSDIYKSASCLSSWIRGTRYAVGDIYKSASCLSSWIRTRYAVRSE